MSLLDDPLQLVIVGGLIVVFIMWGPKKIPELARALGQAKGEFAAGAAQKPAGLSGLASTFASVSSPPLAGSEQLLETAEKLGIPTQGKTAQQISDAIVDRANRTGQSPARA
ncbi:MAG: twin-arginine translocase TatA/TatE family subunit [Nitrososphaerota archaeon]|nr:twin-arginine translocase TatA/TatE family subunit [Nitrososphaerota archaeon]MDG6967463.1 twin-arginine translocase TatA/TatE family subunit [Nitrososphaerota archaeon]MDG6978373.1 twin-arginine translocase TatA/TatE family subunit [Nitrososphaerota archaeon]